MAPQQRQLRTRPTHTVHRYRQQRSRFLIAVTLCLISYVSNVLGGVFDPYTILGVSRAASADEVKKRYRKLCLQYHPDKNVSKSTKERELAEKKFKLVQEAYDMVENGSPPRYQPRSGPGSNPQSNHPFRNDPMADAFFRSFGKSFGNTGNNANFFFYQTGRPGAAFSGRRRSPMFGMGSPFQAKSPGDGHPFAPTDMQFKSSYVQPVKIPLEVLYQGDSSFRFQLKDNLYTRYRASVRGKMIYFSMYQAFVFMLPLLSRSKFLAYIVGLCVIHGTTPIPDPTASYIKPIEKGAKGGETNVTFANSQELEVTFQIEEAKHPVYRRKDNDLYAKLTITSKEAKNGCKKRLEALDPSEKSILITIPPEKFSYKTQQEHRKRGSSVFDYINTIKIHGRGWPIPKTTQPSGNHPEVYRYGDLIVTIRVKKPSSKKR